MDCYLLRVLYTNLIVITNAKPMINTQNTRSKKAKKTPLQITIVDHKEREQEEEKKNYKNKQKTKIFK